MKNSHQLNSDSFFDSSNSFFFDSSNLCRLLIFSILCRNFSMYLDVNFQSILLFAFHCLCNVISIANKSSITVKDAKHMLHEITLMFTYILVIPIYKTLSISEIALNSFHLPIEELAYLGITTRW